MTASIRLKSLSDGIRRHQYLILGIILLFSIAVRIPVIMRNPLPAGDGIASNLEVAVNLRYGLGFSTMRKWTLYDPSMDDVRPEGNRQPVMGVLLFLTFLVSGPGFLPAQLLSLTAGVFCLFMCWIWARKTFGTVPALFTAAVLSVNPLFVWFSTQPDSLLLFTGLFFAVLILADVKEITPGRAVLLGLLVALSYLARTQGLILAFSIGLWILIRGGKKRIIRALLFAAVFLAACAPWFLRNINAFGSPTYTQGGQFLLNENHWAAWEVRETAPGPADMLRNQGPAAVARYLARGVLRVLEPVTTGSMHRGEPFGQPSLTAFALLGLLALRRKDIRRRMLLPLIAVLPPVAALVLHEHSGRYLAFFTAAVTALGAGGLRELTGMTSRKAGLAAALLLVFPYAVPLGKLLGMNSAGRAAEAHEISNWISENTGEDDWVVTFPNSELMIWDYRRPTLTMPNDYEMLLWPCLEKHGVKYVVVDRYLPVVRPHLANRWRWSRLSGDWEVLNPPEFLTEVYRSGSGSSIVYRFAGSVPRGYMAQDSLPPDNYRALPPEGEAW